MQPSNSLHLLMTGIEIQKALDDLCADMKAKLPGFRFCGILSCADGSIIAHSTADPELDKVASEVAPFFSIIIDQVKLVVASCASIGVKETHTLLIETNKTTFVSGISNKGKFFIVLSLEREKANLGIARALIEASRPLATILDEQL